MNKKLDIDKFEELKDKIEDQAADVQERQDFFVNVGNQDDNDELLDELDDLEAEMAAEDFDGLEIGSGAVKNKEDAVPVQSEKVDSKKQQDEADMLAQMMAWLDL